MKIVTWDLETFLFADDDPFPQPVCVAYRAVDGDTRQCLDHGLVHWKDGRFARLFKAWLADDDVLLVGHNAMAYDIPVICTHLPDTISLWIRAFVEMRVTDTRIRAWLGDTAEGRLYGYTQVNGNLEKITYTLEFLARRAGGEKNAQDPWRLRYGELFDTPVKEWPYEAVKYATGDVVETERVFWWQEERWGREILDPQEFVQTRDYWALAVMAKHGIATDQTRVEALEGKLKVRRAEVLENLLALGLLEKKVVHAGKPQERADITAKTAPAHALYLAECEAQGQDPYLTEKGAPSLTEESLAELGLEEHHPLVQWREYKQSGTVLSRVIQALRAPVVRTNYGWAATGRTTSSKPNVQNWHKSGAYRECMTARPGHVLVSVDYDAAELRAVSEVCFERYGFSDLGEALNKGLDPHLALVAQMMGITYEDAKARKKAKDPVVNENRTLGKIGNFGLWGGMGAASLKSYAKQYGVRLDDEQAALIVSTFRSSWRESKPYFDTAQEILSGSRVVECLRSGRRRAVSKYTVTCNTPFQALVADIGKEAVFELVAGFLLGKTTACPLVFVHDEVIAEVPEEELHEGAKVMRDTMVSVANEYLHRVPMTAEPAAMRYWSKSAEPVYDANGRLQVWEPPKP